MSSEQSAVNVQVAVRCRPANEEEKKSGTPLVISTDQERKSVDVMHGAGNKKQSKTYNFDKVFGAYSTQEEVFESTVSPIVQECLAGFNCTIFAYGQTGTGKTHTMEGDIHSEENAGIVPRSIKAIFDTLTSGGAEFTVRVSFLELYNEELQDLLCPNGTKASTSNEKKLRLCEVENKGVVVQNLEEVTVLNSNDIFEILQKGIQQRATAATNMNKNSSRSHSIFTMKIMIKETNVEGEEVVRHGQLNLVDLAGSECVGRSGAKNDRAREAGNINQSLLTLGRVITALVDHHGHVPYRDSKLTRLLQESLGGKAKTCIIATLSPSQLAAEETMSTLDYAHKAKNIKNKPLVNQKMTKQTVLKEYCEEIESLRTMLQLTREKNGVYVDPEQFYGMEQRIASQETQIAEVERVLKQKQEEHKTMKAEKEEVEARVGGLEKNLSDTTARFETTKSALEESKISLAKMEVENRANECVISEQVQSEERLATEGAGLQSEVTVQRSARDALLMKVDSLKQREVRRTNETTQFVGDVVANSQVLCQGVDQMLISCDSQSSALCEGVSTMLSKGKLTCETLRGSIKDALESLIGDTSNAKDCMVSSCDEISSQMNSTQTKFAASMSDLETALSGWLDEVSATMEKTEQIMQSQEQMVTQAKDSLKNYESTLAAMLKNAITANTEHGLAAAQEQKVLHAKIMVVFQEHDQALQVQNKDTKDFLQSQADELKALMGSALDKMVTTASCEMDANLEQNIKSNATASAIVVEGLEAQASVWENLNTTAMDKMTEMRGEATTYSKTAMADLGTVLEKRKAAHDLVEGVSSTVSAKKAKLADTSSYLLAEVDAAVEGAKKTASSTAQSASTLLADVKRATGSMEAASSSSIEGFSSFLDGQGDSISEGVSSHFADLGTYLAGAKDSMGCISTGAAQFASALEADPIVTSGNTPAKVPKYFALADLATLATRDHDIIRIESRTGAWVTSTSEVVEEASAAATEGKMEEKEESCELVQEIDAPAVEAIPEATTTATMEVEVQEEPAAPALPSSRRSSKSSSAPSEEPVEEADSENVANAVPAPRGRARSGLAKPSSMKAPSSRARSSSRSAKN